MKIDWQVYTSNKSCEIKQNVYFNYKGDSSSSKPQNFKTERDSIKMDTLYNKLEWVFLLWKPKLLTLLASSSFSSFHGKLISPAAMTLKYLVQLFPKMLKEFNKYLRILECMQDHDG